MQHQCLTNLILSQLVEGRLPEPALSLALIELEACPSCRDRFQQSLEQSAREFSGISLQAVEVETIPSDIFRIPSLSDRSETAVDGMPGSDVIDSRFSHFLVLRQISQGMNARVLEASDPRLNRKVAIKVLEREFARSDPAQVNQFLDEARTVAQINHPAIVPIFDVGTFEEQPYIVMPLLMGESLRTRLERGPIDPGESVHLTLQLLDGLKAAHDFGVIHKDLKPENLWLIPNRNGTRDLVILDFGNAQLTNTMAATATGTPLYVSPEQVMLGMVDARTDFFALGTVLHEMLTGKPVWGTACEEELSRPSSDPGIPAPFAPVLEKLLTLEPADRYSSHVELKHDLQLMLKNYEKKRNLKLVAVLTGAFLFGFLGAVTIFNPMWSKPSQMTRAAGTQTPKAEPPKGKEPPSGQPLPIRPVGRFQAKAGTVFAASQKGLLIVNDAKDGHICVIDPLHDFERVAVLSGSQNLKQAWISQSGTIIAALVQRADSAAEIKIWRLDDKSAVAPVEPKWVLPVTRKSVYDAALMEADGRVLLALSTDEWAIRFYRISETESGTPEEFSIKYDYSQIMRLVPHPDGKLLAGMKEMGGIDIFDVGSRTQRYSFRAFDSGPADGDWSPDRNRLIANRRKKDILVYDLRDAVPATASGRGYLRLQTAYESPYRVDQAVFMDMEMLLVITSATSKELYVHDLRANKFTHRLDTENDPPKSIARISASRAVSVSDSGMIRIYDLSRSHALPR